MAVFMVGNVKRKQYFSVDRQALLKDRPAIEGVHPCTGEAQRLAAG